MNYTENYHLPQWEENDRIMRTDFNNAMAALENGVRRAQDTADNAYTVGKYPYMIGSYVGNGETTTIELGFRPRFIIITAQPLAVNENYTKNIMLAGPGLMDKALTFLDNGFSILNYISTATYAYDKPRMNNAGTTYHYIAFR